MAIKIKILTGSTFLMLCFQLFKSSESSSFKAEIRFKEFDTNGSRGRNYKRQCCDTTVEICSTQCFFKFQICFLTSSNSLIICFNTSFIPEDISNRTTTFPEIISSNLSNRFIVQLSSLKIGFHITVYSKNNSLFNIISSQIEFDSVGVEKYFYLKGGLNEKIPNTLTFYGKLTCDGNLKPPECIEKVCVEKDDNINGHYICDKNGSMICREGWEDPFTNCLKNIFPSTRSSNSECSSHVIHHNSTGFQVLCICNNKDVFILVPGFNLTECFSSNKLSTVTFIGCVNSIFAIFLSIVAYIVFRNHRKVPQKILIHFFCSLLFLVITLLIGIKETYKPRSCHAVSTLLHFFTLTSFGWMSVEFLSIYRNVFHRYQGSRFFYTMSASTWGFSAIVAGLTSLFTKVLFNGLNSSCYVGGKMFISLTVLPITCTVLLDLLLLFKVVRKLQSHSPIMKKYRSRKLLLVRIRFIFTCFVLLILAWVFGVLAILDFRTSYQWVFSVINSFLGFYIYIDTMKHVAVKKTNRIPELAIRKSDLRTVMMESKA